MSKVFIFGCGYLGLHLVDALHAQGFTVGALTKNPSTVEQLRGKGFCEVIESRLSWMIGTKKSPRITRMWSTASALQAMA